MYKFWFECFQIENKGGCNKYKIKKHLPLFLMALFSMLVLVIVYLIWKYFQKKKKENLLSLR